MYKHVLLLSLLLCFSASASVINIPQDFSTIQEGIDASSNGDTVLVADGFYQDIINFGGRAITVASHFLIDGDTSHVAATSIYPSANYVYTIVFDHNEGNSSRLIGFNLSDGWAAIRCNSASPQITHNIIRNNFIDDYEMGGMGAAIRCDFSTPIIENNTIIDNTIWSNLGGWDGAGIGCYFSDATIRNNVISRNNCYQGGGIFCYESSPLIENNIITENQAYLGSAIFCELSSPVIRGNTISDNNTMCNGVVYLKDNSNAVFENGSINNNHRVNAGNGLSNAMDGFGIVVQESAPIIGTAENPLSIYQNAGCYGRDILLMECSNIEVFVDTFTVINPDERMLFPFDLIEININTSMCPPIGNATELYVSPRGHNDNSGLNEDEPMREIDAALLRLPLSTSTTSTLHLMPGTYSEESCGQDFPVYLHSNLVIAGSGEETTILESDGEQNIINMIKSNNVSISNLTFANAYTGIFIDSCLNVNIADNKFYANQHGGVFAKSRSRVNVSENIFCENSNEWYAAGLTIYFSEYSTASNNLIEENLGCGVLFMGSPGMIRNNIFRNNELINDYNGSSGLMVQSVPPYYGDETDSLFIYNNLIYNNNAMECAYSGGGLTASSVENTKICNNTIVGNSISGTADDNAGGIYISRYSNLLFENNIVSGNTYNSNISNIMVSDTSTVQYNLVEGGFIGTGNFDTDPLFADESEYLLSFDSPAIDAGNPASHYHDRQDPANPNMALWPSQGTLVNDVGWTGGQHARTFNWMNSPDGNNQAEIPVDFILYPPYPNPFNSTAYVTVELPVGSRLSVSVFDILGREVTTLSNQYFNQGNHKFVLDGSYLASGTYFIRARVNNWNDVKRVILIN